MQELIFWLIFSVVAATLIFTQVAITVPKPVVSQPSKVELPDVAKKDNDVQLIYENEVISEKLSKLSQERITIYALGEFSGPAFNEKSVKEGALQVAFQVLISELELLKNSLLQQLNSVLKGEKNEALLVRTVELFEQLYQRLPLDGSLAVTYKIWRKGKGEVTTYYYLVLFDDEYARSLIESIGTDLVQQLQDYDISFKELWEAALAGYAKQKSKASEK